MLLHMGGSTRGWGESVCESSRCHLKNTGTSNDSIYPQGGRDCPCLPSKQPQQGFVPGPGQLSLGRSRRQWTTRGRKYSQKQLAKALAQHTPCLYLLRGLDLVQILEKKNRKCFTCYLIWSSCSEQFCAQAALWCRTGPTRKAHEGCVGPGKAHLQFPRDFTQHDLSLQHNIPISAISPVLSHAQGRQIELVSISKSWRTDLHISKLWNLLPEDLPRTLKHLPDI